MKAISTQFVVSNASLTLTGKTVGWHDPRTVSYLYWPNATAKIVWRPSPWRATKFPTAAAATAAIANLTAHGQTGYTVPIGKLEPAITIVENCPLH